MRVDQWKEGCCTRVADHIHSIEAATGVHGSSAQLRYPSGPRSAPNANTSYGRTPSYRSGLCGRRLADRHDYPPSVLPTRRPRLRGLPTPLPSRLWNHARLTENTTSDPQWNGALASRANLSHATVPSVNHALSPPRSYLVASSSEEVEVAAQAPPSPSPRGGNAQTLPCFESRRWQ